MKNYNQEYWAKRVVKYNNTRWVQDRNFIETFLELLPQQTFNSILEIGIGTGVLAERVVEYLGPLTGIDISEEMISMINHSDITTIVADAHNLPFENNVFNLIYIRNVLHYIKDPRQVFSEIYRCLQPGGYFLFSQVVPPDDSISEEYDWLIGRKIHYPTQEEIIQLHSNFSNVKKDYYILRNQSIMNWLNNTFEENHIREDIINRHKSTSDKYKDLVNYVIKNDDILVDIKHLMLLSQKR